MTKYKCLIGGEKEEEMREIMSERYPGNSGSQGRIRFFFLFLSLFTKKKMIVAKNLYVRIVNTFENVRFSISFTHSFDKNLEAFTIKNM